MPFAWPTRITTGGIRRWLERQGVESVTGYDIEATSREFCAGRLSASQLGEIALLSTEGAEVHCEGGMVTAQPEPIEPGQETPDRPEDFYGNGGNGGDIITDPQDPIGGSVGTVLLSPVILARFGSQVARAVVGPLFRMFGATTKTWNSMPSWARQVAIWAGIAEGTDIVIQSVDLPSPSDVPQWLSNLPGYPAPGAAPLVPVRGGGMATLPVAMLQPPYVIGTWMANEVPFYRLWDGRLACIRKDGRVRVWRPKSPIVLFADGAGNLRTLLRADAVLNRQSKRLRSMLDRRAPRRSKKKEIIIESGPGHVVKT